MTNLLKIKFRDIGIRVVYKIEITDTIMRIIVVSARTDEQVYKEAAKLTGCKNFCRIRRLDDHRFFAADWNIEISTRNPVPEGADWIGYRAHDFIPVRGSAQDNCIPVKPGRVSELPFEYNYYVKPVGKEESPMIRWFVQREQVQDIIENGFPDYLKVKEDRIMYLMDSCCQRKC